MEPISLRYSKSDAGRSTIEESFSRPWGTDFYHRELFAHELQPKQLVGSGENKLEYIGEGKEVVRDDRITRVKSRSSQFPRFVGIISW